MEGSVIVVNMGAESYNDALYYLKQAQEAEKNGEKFLMWRNTRSSILSMCLSAESDLSKLILINLRKKENRNMSEEEVYSYLNDSANSDSKPPKEFWSVLQKYNKLLELNGLEKVDELPNDYKSAVYLRNKVAHYVTAHNEKVYSETIVKDVENALENIRKFIRYIWEISNEGNPKWIDKTESWVID